MRFMIQMKGRFEVAFAGRQYNAYLFCASGRELVYTVLNKESRYRLSRYKWYNAS